MRAIKTVVHFDLFESASDGRSDEGLLEDPHLVSSSAAGDGGAVEWRGASYTSSTPADGFGLNDVESVVSVFYLYD